MSSRVFLELSEPTIETGVARLAERGVRQLLVLPILLFEAAHAKADIPEAVAQAAIRYGLKVAGQTSALGTLPAAVELAERRFRTARSQIAGLSERTALAMVGRGTSDAEALGAMRRLTRLLVERPSVRVDWVETGFFAGGQPTVESLLEEAAGSGCKAICCPATSAFRRRADRATAKARRCLEKEQTRADLGDFALAGSR